MTSPLMLDINELFDFDGASMDPTDQWGESPTSPYELAERISAQHLFPVGYLESPRKPTASFDFYHSLDLSSSASSSSFSNPSTPQWPHQELELLPHIQTHGHHADGSPLFHREIAREDAYGEITCAVSCNKSNMQMLPSPRAYSLEPLLPVSSTEYSPSYDDAEECPPGPDTCGLYAFNVNTRRSSRATSQKRPLKFEDSDSSDDSYVSPVPSKRRRMVPAKRVHESDDEFQDEETDEGRDDLASDSLSPSPCSGSSTDDACIARWPCQSVDCDETFSRETDLKRHSQTVHGTSSRSQILSETRDSYRLWCSKCPKILARVDSRRRHEQRGSCGKRSSKMQARKGKPFKLDD